MSNCIENCSKKFNIQGLTRLREDSCYLDVHNKHAEAPGKYMTSNFHDCKCNAPFTQELSLQQPVINFKDGYGWTSNKGCNIDSDSKLRNASNLTNPRVIQQLHQRPYLTVPYMGRGEGNTCVESSLRSSETTVQRRPCNTLSGIYIDRFTPQIPCVRDTIQNPTHIIPEDNKSDWVRGGQPSRQIVRNADYLNKCGYQYNGKYWTR